MTETEESSAVSEVLITSDINTSEVAQYPGQYVLFLTEFPSLSDMRLILTTGFLKVYFFGEVTDPNTVKLINDWNTLYNSLEIIKLEKT